MASRRRRRIKREEKEKLHGRLANIRYRRRGRGSLGSEIVKGQIEKASAGEGGPFPMPGVPQAGQMPGMPGQPQQQQQPDATARQPGPEPLDPARALQTQQKLDAKGLPPEGVQAIVQGDTAGVWNLPGIRAAYYGAKEKSRRLRSAIDTLRSGGVEGLHRMLGPTGGSGGGNATSGNQVTPDQSSFLGGEEVQQQTPGGMISEQVSQVMGGPGLPGPGQSMGDAIQQAGGASAAPVPMLSGKAAAFKAGFWRKMAELGKLPSDLDEELTKQADLLDYLKATGSGMSAIGKGGLKAYALGGLALPFGVGLGGGLASTRLMAPDFEDIEGLRDATKLRELRMRTQGVRTKTQKRLAKIKADREELNKRSQTRLQRLQQRRDPGAEVDSIIQSVGA
jgi:hypothetical protein